MRRADRLFEIIQLLRRARRPVTASELADGLEVNPRTVYRDMAALQAMRVPIEGAAGIGYVMRRGFDLPPLMFTAEEVEAIMVGLSLVTRTGDVGLLQAAQGASGKIADVLPESLAGGLDAGRLKVSSWGAEPPAADLKLCRRAVREERKLKIAYRDENDRASERTILPLAVIYYVAVTVIAAWCELRQDYRHFRADRIRGLEILDGRFADRGDSLRANWLKQQGSMRELLAV
jgi:predicted DNA-binding transcriptional regulator YafY